MDYIEKIAKGFNINPKVVALVEKCQQLCEEQFLDLDKMAEINQLKVLEAFQQHRVSDSHFGWHTGYGYDDPGRDVIEKIFATVMGCEKAVVRTNIVNGTHALSLSLSSILRPGDKMIYGSGKPYDTLEEVIGVRGENMGSLKEFNIEYDQVELLDGGIIDVEGILKAITPNTKLIGFQRATGYSWRPAITVEQLASAIEIIKKHHPDMIIMVDNCYGEFLDHIEPTQVGADIMAGSLIKNPGGGLALSGGYVCGRKDLIDLVHYRLTCPGIGGECGLTFGQTRNMLQGFFMAPVITISALKGAILCGKVFEHLGFPVCPQSNQKRSDIIQAITLGSEEAVVAFCQGIQMAAPVDSFVRPEPWDMPGYEEPVVMAAGAFVQGSSIELSADAPIREPYNVYFQGGLTYAHSKLGVMKALDQLVKKDIIKL